MSPYIAFLISLFLSTLFTPLVRKTSTRLGFVDHPKKDRWHSKPTPLMGGIAIFVAVLFSLLYLFNGALPAESLKKGVETKEFTLLAGVIAIFVLGLLDDIYHMKPQIKLLGQIIITSLVIFGGIKVEIITQPFIAVPLSILWIVGITNAFNLLDNMDGLSSGVAFISSIILSIYAYINADPVITGLALSVAGASLGFFFYNFYPASIFMGDCGSMTLGFTLSCIALMGTWQHASNLIITMLVPLMILAVPIFDTVLVTFTRKLYGRPISMGGKDHSSHRLVALGLTEKKAVLVLFLISLGFGSIVILGTWMNIFTTIIIILISGVFLFFFGVFLGEIQVYESVKDPYEDEYIDSKKPILNTFIYNKRRIAEVFIDLIQICVAYLGAYLLRFGGEISSSNLDIIKDSLPIIIAVKFFYFYIFALYKSEWRYVGLNDLVVIFKGTVLSTLTIMAFVVFIERFEGYSRAVFIIDWLLSMILLSGSRISLRVFREHIFNHKKGAPIIICGAGDFGELFLRDIKKNKDLNYQPVGFVDDKSSKVGLRIHGVPVLGTTRELEHIIKREGIKEVIVTMSSPKQTTLERIREACQKTGVRLSMVYSSIQHQSNYGDRLH